jgi:hypothetical protein
MAEAIVLLAMVILGQALIGGLFALLLTTFLALRHKYQTSTVQFGLGSLFAVTTMVAVVAAIPITGFFVAFVAFLLWLNVMADYKASNQANVQSNPK